MHNSLFGKKI